MGTVTLAEVTGLALVSAAVPRDGDEAFAAALVGGFGAVRPGPGDSALGARDAIRVLGMQPDQVFILFASPNPDLAVPTVAAALGSAAYVTDQSDSWAMLRMSGTGVRAALDRICPLDLDEGAFPEGRVARTVMEHLSVIILRDGPDSFLLMSPRSSARSFRQAVELSVENVFGP
jgi:sarcosine oxidase subunit gamma